MKASKLIKKQQEEKPPVYKIDDPANFAHASNAYLKEMLNIYKSSTIVSDDSIKALEAFLSWNKDQAFKSYGPAKRTEDSSGN